MGSLGYQVSSPNLEVAFSQPHLTPHPCPRALASASSLSHLATSGSAPQGARFYASAPGQPTWDKTWVGAGACRFPRREGVARGGSRCPACPDLLLGHCAPDPRGSRGWGLEVVTHLRPQSHLVTKSASGRPRSSDFQAFAEDVPPGARMAGEEAAELRALARRSTHARSFELSFTCSALQLFSSAPWGTASPPLCPGGCAGPAATLDP